MRPFICFLPAAFFATVVADLTCLEWALVSPLVGIFCHFEPSTFQNVEGKASTAAEEAINSTRDLLEFDLTHNPVAITYNFVDRWEHAGLQQGEQYLHNITTDFRDVTVGFGKETANQVIQIYRLTQWNDLTQCLIVGAGQAQTSSSRFRSKRAPRLGPSDGLSIARQCVSNKLQRLSQPAVFQVNGSSQHIGSTISQLATFFVPVGAEGEVSKEAISGVVDLAIPGSEESTRIYKLAEGVGAHFANDEEANSVAAQLDDPVWVEENCSICRGPGIKNLETARRLSRRGNIVSSCCRVPIEPTGFKSDSDSHASTNSVPESSDNYPVKPASAPVKPPLQEQIGDILVPPPDYPLRSIALDSDIIQIRLDLRKYSTSLVQWGSPVTDTMHSDQVFALMRNMFRAATDKASQDDPLIALFQVRQRDGRFRYVSPSASWVNSPRAELQPLIRFVKAAVEQCKDTVSKLKNLTPTQTDNLRGNIEFFYTPPSSLARQGVDPRGMHTDMGIMQFAAADTPGLVIRRPGGAVSRVVPKRDSFHLIKAAMWDGPNWTVEEAEGPTWHSVFGPDMARDGRVSMVLSIFERPSFGGPEMKFGLWGMEDLE